MYYIYKIENLINHKKYIGLTNNVARRRARHFTDLRYNRHDNTFLQKEFNIYGESNFSFEVVFEGDVTSQEIGIKEQEYIKFYDSYKNGYNQNEGGNFGPTNGGSQLMESDVLNILAALEFQSRSGQILAEMYGVTRTTISRIKQGISHTEVKEMYDKMPLEERQCIYEIFCDSTNFIDKKVHTTIIQSKRKLTRDQVFMILYNYEYKILSKAEMAKLVNVSSPYTLDCIKNNITYKDYNLEYSQLTENQKEQIASLFSNK